MGFGVEEKDRAFRAPSRACATSLGRERVRGSQALRSGVVGCGSGECQEAGLCLRGRIVQGPVGGPLRSLRFSLRVMGSHGRPVSAVGMHIKMSVCVGSVWAGTRAPSSSIPGAHSSWHKVGAQ